MIINNICEKREVPVPEAIITIAIGVIWGGFAYDATDESSYTFAMLESTNACIFMVFFIAPIIFAEGYGMNSAAFMENIWRIMIHAFVGTFLSAVVVALALYYFPRWYGGITTPLTMPECLSFGSLISATDPVTTLVIFKAQNLVEKNLGHLYYSVLGEAVLNDAVAIVLFQTFSKLVVSGTALSQSVCLNMIGEFAFTFVVSTLLGFFFGCLTALVLKIARLGEGDHEEDGFTFNVPEIGIALVGAYLPYLFTQAIGLSGITAIMFAGMAMRKFGHANITLTTRDVYLPLVELIANMSETWIFVMLGVAVWSFPDKVSGGNLNTYSLHFFFYTVFGILVGRAVHVYPCGMILNICGLGPKLSLNELHMTWFAGLRGAVAFICALGFPGRPDGTTNGTLILSTTTAIAWSTILLFGWPTAAALNCLGIHGDPIDDKKPRMDTQSPPPPTGPLMKRLERFLLTNEAYYTKYPEEEEEAEYQRMSEARVSEITHVATDNDRDRKALRFTTAPPTPQTGDEEGGRINRRRSATEAPVPVPEIFKGRTRAASRTVTRTRKRLKTGRMLVDP